ncbi:MAG: (d)CMP kinase, partial [Chloroflexota bacterium]
MNEHARVIAIDGPAAAGKSTVAALLADRLNAMLFDTGSLYRAVTLAALQGGISPHDADGLAALVGDVDIALRAPTVTDGRIADVVLDGEDVTWLVRTPEVDRWVSAVSAHAGVRSALLPVQRRIAANIPVVMVGRDIGTAVIPDAGVKIYLDATPEERARRRTDELVARGNDADYDAILAEILRRDHADSTRSISPLERAPDAVVIATDGKSAAEAAD